LLEVLDRDANISIKSALGRDINSDASSHQAFEWNLIQRLPTSGKVNGRIDVGAAMFGYLQAV
jgi:hypothetical protein